MAFDFSLLLDVIAFLGTGIYLARLVLGADRAAPSILREPNFVDAHAVQRV